ncbi:MAG: STAS domain-containing protein [Methylophilales bacterium]|nr:STAS domain-containing protein [Methylophilales bacterium]
MNITRKQDGDNVTLILNGRFDFSVHRDFRTSYEDVLKIAGIKKITLDMAAVDYLDSSALGMLLLLNERARNTSAEVNIARCSAGVTKILDIANFSKIIKIT